MKRSVLVIAGLAAGVCAQAQTPSPAPQPADWQAALKVAAEACKGDIPKLCPGLSSDTAMACLQSNIDKVTPGCKDAVTQLAKSALSFL
jgi:hypothetical protein